MELDQSHYAEAAGVPGGSPSPVRCAGVCWLSYRWDFLGRIPGSSLTPRGHYCHWTATSRHSKVEIRSHTQRFSVFASGSPDDRCELWAGSGSPSQLCVCFLWCISLGCLSGWFLLLKHRTGCTADSSTCSSPQHKHLKYSKYENHQFLIFFTTLNSNNKCMSNSENIYNSLKGNTPFWTLSILHSFDNIFLYL